ncbi:maleylpyruvate isomerase family mycothiol-dependent enzyme [Nocardioides anomalus]|uniref:Maleylpyruvate isomerase family mycothiol-dependent enzyme n=1 Tax=Nocardioides anomalus TaxID=2712223 RepID=A0A6G6WJL8_9ACTN|nr:maleylpyruvate isomerase family mycothiol-dependent enzyme [Nocardioides anomalus]QIG45260.1 maleylpyruvate isomerase family mycothiol-dependent enzyme [Nocardioides anomalus]
MPTQLTTAQHLAGLREAASAFTTYADRAGVDAPVPTCPEWTVLDLVAHQGMVHRWAAALVRGRHPDDDEVTGFEAAGRAAADPTGWLAEGVADLASALEAAPETLDAPVFLLDAPRPAAFWARRQCHETSVHAVDALAAALGRPPRADEVWLDPELAGDGIDELLGGFLTRPRSRLRCEEDALLVVRPDDVTDWWSVELGPRPARTTRHGGAEPPEADWELTGGAVELYLRLWNRTDAAGSEGPADQWRHLTAVRWS